MISLVLRFFGYAKVPPEIVTLACQTRMIWEKKTDHAMVGRGLDALEKFLRSTQ